MKDTMLYNWKEHITTDDKILQGKPIIKGTRLSLEFILERLANGWTEAEILENYPRLSPASLKAIYAYTYHCMKDGLLFFPKNKRA